MSVHSAREARIIAADSGKKLEATQISWVRTPCNGSGSAQVSAGPCFLLSACCTVAEGEEKHSGVALGQQGGNAAKEQIAIGMLTSSPVPAVRNSPVLIPLN